jgi:hypothetical protein
VRIPVALFDFENVFPALLACLDTVGLAPLPSARPGQVTAGSTLRAVPPSAWSNAS